MDRNDTPDRSRALPSRRRFLAMGSASVVGAAVLAACSKNSGPVESTGTTVTTSVPPTAPVGDLTATQNEADASLMRTATSFELLAAETYTALLAKPFASETDADTLAALRLFETQHTAAAKALADATKAAGATAYDKPNDYAKQQVIDPALANVSDTAGLLGLANQLESISAATCAQSASQLGTPELRQAIMAVGGSSARREAVLNIAIAKGNLGAGVPNARFDTRSALGTAALVK